MLALALETLLENLFSFENGKNDLAKHYPDNPLDGSYIERNDAIPTFFDFFLQED